MLASFDVDAEVVVALAPEKQLAGESVDVDGVGRHFRQPILGRIGWFKCLDTLELFEWLTTTGLGLTALRRSTPWHRATLRQTVSECRTAHVQRPSSSTLAPMV